ncbi:hypothetical protein PO909_020007 [Leuciscus waleckii]
MPRILKTVNMSHPIPQTSYFQVKIKLYTQNHSLLLKNQTLPTDRTHKPSKSHTNYNIV